MDDALQGRVVQDNEGWTETGTLKGMVRTAGCFFEDLRVMSPQAKFCTMLCATG